MAAFKSFALLAFAGAAISAAAFAAPINTANENGAYHKDFCPALQKQLADAKLDYQCTPSEGSVDNIARSLADPKHIGFSQFDIFARETQKLGGAPLTLIRSDLGRECLFMVTKNKSIKTFGELAARAGELRFVLPPQGSGSAATFEYLQSIDPQGLGRAGYVSYAGSTDAAIATALDGDENTIVLFVQFPDPNNERFKLIDEKEGQFIPVIDRAILRQEVGGQKVYFAQETEISNPKFLAKGQTVVTACTPVALFTGSPERIKPGEERANHEDMIRSVRAFEQASLMPKEGFFAGLWKKTKELSAEGVEKALKLSEEAREQAQPFIDQAKEKAEELKQRAKDMTGGGEGKKEN